MFFRALGANQRVESQPRICPTASFLETENGRTASGAMSGSAITGCATIFAPQNAQAPATSAGSNVVVAPHESHVICTALAESRASRSGPAWR